MVVKLEDECTYQVIFDKILQEVILDSEEEEEIKVRIIKKTDQDLLCSCNLYLTDGIICRHLFCFAKVIQIKDLSSYLHPRWLIKKEKSSGCA